MFLLSNPGSVLVGFIKMDVVFIKCWLELAVFWTVLRMNSTVYRTQMSCVEEEKPMKGS